MTNHEVVANHRDVRAGLTQRQRNFIVDKLPRNLTWDRCHQQEALNSLYDFIESQAFVIIKWYLSQARKRATLAKLLRYSTIILICLGGLMPIIDGVAVSLFDYQNISRLGYVFLGLGLALLSFDRFSGTCNTWIRYVATGFKLQTLLAEFQMDWSRLQASACARVAPAVSMAAGDRVGAVDGDVGAALGRLKAFYSSLLKEVENEIAIWAAEFQTTTAFLEAAAREQARSLAPGSILVVVEDRSNLKSGVKVLLDGNPVASIDEAEHEIAHVLAGRHTVTLEGVMKDDRRAVAERTVMVSPGQMLPVRARLVAQEASA